jgi:histidinol dehydrogenase
MAVDRHATTVRPIIENIQARGAKSLRAIAAELTRMRVPTARGGTEWSAQQDGNLQNELGERDRTAKDPAIASAQV